MQAPAASRKACRGLQGSEEAAVAAQAVAAQAVAATAARAVAAVGTQAAEPAQEQVEAQAPALAVVVAARAVVVAAQAVAAQARSSHHHRLRAHHQYQYRANRSGPATFDGQASTQALKAQRHRCWLDQVPARPLARGLARLPLTYSDR